MMRHESSRARHDALEVCILTGMTRSQSRETPALANGHPRDNARVVEIPHGRTLPFRHQSFFGNRRPASRIGHLFPNHQPEFVAPVEIARVFDLLMLARAVVSVGLGPFDVRTY